MGATRYRFVLEIHARTDTGDAAVFAGFGPAESVCKLLADSTPEPELEKLGWETTCPFPGPAGPQLGFSSNSQTQ